MSSCIVKSNSTSDSETLLGLWPNSVVINSAVSPSITSVAVAIIPFFINSLTTSAVLSVILLASSDTVIVSGIITSLNCFTAGVWSACILAFSRLLLIDARDLTLTLSASNARAIVIFPCLFSFSPLFQVVFFTFSLYTSLSWVLFAVHTLLLLGTVSSSANFCLSFSACKAASSAFLASICACFCSSSIFFISSISSVSAFLLANILSLGAKLDAAFAASSAFAAIRASSILAFSIFSAAIISACAAVLARPSCNILLLEWISFALKPELFSKLVFSLDASFKATLLSGLFVLLTSTWTVLLPDLELVVTLLGNLEDERGFFKVNFPPKERLNFFLSPLVFSSII